MELIDYIVDTSFSRYIATKIKDESFDLDKSDELLLDQLSKLDIDTQDIMSKYVDQETKKIIKKKFYDMSSSQRDKEFPKIDHKTYIQELLKVINLDIEPRVIIKAKSIDDGRAQEIIILEQYFLDKKIHEDITKDQVNSFIDRVLFIVNILGKPIDLRHFLNKCSKTMTDIKEFMILTDRLKDICSQYVKDNLDSDDNKEHKKVMFELVTNL